MPEVDLILCDFCGGCTAVCPENAITVFDNDWKVDKELCVDCYICNKICPVRAIMIETD